MNIMPKDMIICEKVLELKPDISGKEFYKFIRDLDYYEAVGKLDLKLDSLIEKYTSKDKKEG